jgi:hypothetical protein
MPDIAIWTCGDYGLPSIFLNTNDRWAALSRRRVLMPLLLLPILPLLLVITLLLILMMTATRMLENADDGGDQYRQWNL